MAWLTPEEFELAVKIERKEGGAGFLSLLIAAYIRDDGYAGMLVAYWPEMFDGAHDFNHRAAHVIVDEYKRARFAVFFAAAALHADLENRRKIEQICPGLNEEVSIRYNTPGSMIPGESRVFDGKKYECFIDGLTDKIRVEVASE